MYDKENFVIHRLDADMAAVWRLADGTRDIATLAGESGVSDVNDSLQRLANSGLVKAETLGKSNFSRRRLIGGAAGAAAAVAFIAPAAASPQKGAYCGPNYIYSGIACKDGSHTGVWQCDSCVGDNNGGPNKCYWNCR
ncbi:MAG: hypothetical protein KC435_01670 [Thermomicrobiales bacterium]|nr:hypothetical protein [Thermomicrobiales bacterium]